MPVNTELFTYLERRRSALEKERVSFESHWKSLSEYIQPRRGRFFVSDRNKGEKRHNNIINSAGTQALRAATAGMFAGIMSPSRPWFNLGLKDTVLMEDREVGHWLDQVEKIIYGVFAESNLYNQAPVMLSELLLFSTGCMIHVDDPDSIARFYTQTVGSYYLGQNNRREIDTFMRKYDSTVGAIVQEFGIDAVPENIKTLYDRGEYDKWFEIIHLIEPRRERSRDNPFSSNAPFRSVYYTYGSNNSIAVNDKRILRESGFDSFPVYAPRWGTTGEDIYGTDCPGMVVLGDVRQLQTQERRKQQAIDKLVNPPLKGPPSLRNTEVSGLPGALTVYENQGGTADSGLSPVYIVNPQLQEMTLDIEKTERRIQEGFFNDLFLAITNANEAAGKQYKNEMEILQRNEERLLQLGPVLEQLHNEFLDKLISRTFAQLIRNELIPEAPPVLQGQPLEIHYISSLAQAQRAVATGAIERLATFAGGLAQFSPEAFDKFDSDQAIDEYNRAILGPPRIVRSDEEVEASRQQRQQMMAAQQALEMGAQGASMVKDGAAAISEVTQSA